MRARLVVLALAVGTLAGCIMQLSGADRFTCQSNAECDEGAGEVCGGFEVWTDKSCAEPPAKGAPYYISEPDPATCYFSYCVPASHRDCGTKQCAGDTTCIGFKNNEGKIEVECYDRQAMNDSTSCDGYDDTTNCGDGRRVRYLEYRRTNPTGTDLGYRCLR